MIGIVCAFFHTEGKGFYSSRQLRLYSRGSADPRESLRRRRISKLALSAHKVLSTPHGTGACRCAFKAGEKKQREIFFGIRIENVCYIIHDMIR